MYRGGGDGEETDTNANIIKIKKTIIQRKQHQQNNNDMMADGGRRWQL